MTLLSRIFGKRPDERDAFRPLWNGVVEAARDKRWYAQLGVADTVPGRFDMISLVCALVALRLAHDEPQGHGSARLTELFVEDMDAQLRQSGVGDPTVGKHVRKLVTTLGGRIGALREALPQGEAALVPVLERNMTMREGAPLQPLAHTVEALARHIDAMAMDELLSGRIGPAPL